MTDPKHSETSTTKNYKQNFLDKYKSDSILIEAQFSFTIHRIYRRHFDRFSRSVFLIRYYSQILGKNSSNQEAILTERIQDLLTELITELNNNIEVSNSVLSQSDTNFIKRTGLLNKYNVTVVDPLANHFLKCLNVAQEYEKLLRTMWLATLMNQKEFDQAINNIDSKFKGVSSSSRTLSIGVRDAVRQMRNNHKDNINPVDESLDTKNNDDYELFNELEDEEIA